MHCDVSQLIALLCYFFLLLVVVLCAAPRKVREIMLAAEELNMVSSGEYVFFNIELLNRFV